MAALNHLNCEAEKVAKIKGGCLCGEVQYESTAEPLMVAACHCTNCRKQSGTAFSMNIGVPADSVSVTGGSLTTYEDAGASGEPVLRKFCNKCGSPILTNLKAADGVSFIKAGTLDDSSWVVPGAEIWCDSKASWGSLGEALPKMPGNPPFG
ncbi:GFA family protein [Granulosicoccus antarcticus]|uniref:Glutathione-dependent formaldehyde-activating enzyme n=1 Tax=Granulosicoccus antarcticus IMCC3135 TaxID=1192854 RepID=A0A2Z2P0Q8_9GAMM|nr:GFA family protein [Granulosicoccus antarcticus]ASJ73094.1 Glutathione-dependent formaldehyde-activating enzyme [Granulosicoccus antarcticus IMCC3135]